MFFRESCIRSTPTRKPYSLTLRWNQKLRIDWRSLEQLKKVSNIAKWYPTDKYQNRVNKNLSQQTDLNKVKFWVGWTVKSFWLQGFSSDGFKNWVINDQKTAKKKICGLKMKRNKYKFEILRYLINESDIWEQINKQKLELCLEPVIQLIEFYGFWMDLFSGYLLVYN